MTKQQQPHQITHLCISIDTSDPSVNGCRTSLSKYESRGFLRKMHFEDPVVEHCASGIDSMCAFRWRFGNFVEVCYWADILISRYRRSFTSSAGSPLNLLSRPLHHPSFEPSLPTQRLPSAYAHSLLLRRLCLGSCSTLSLFSMFRLRYTLPHPYTVNR